MKMKTVSEIEAESELVRQQMMKIVDEISCGFDDKRGLEIASELSDLLRKAKGLQLKIEYFNDMAERLFMANCSGPH